MDRCREIDNVQNTNAVYIDQYGSSGKTSVKTSNPPGGKSSFSLGWGYDQEEPKTSTKTQKATAKSTVTACTEEKECVTGKGKKAQQKTQKSNTATQETVNPPQQKTSVKVKYAPGGQSSIVFGTDDIKYDSYKKNI